VRTALTRTPSPYTTLFRSEVTAFDTDKGDLKWADAVVRSTRTLAVSGLTDVAASPVISDGVVFATGVSGRTIAVRLADGERLWRSEEHTSELQSRGHLVCR